MRQESEPKMKTMNATYSNVLKMTIATVLPLAVGFGCAGKGQANSTEFFPVEETASVQRFQDVQIANGANEDATLYPQHFTNGQLNGLGEAKLDAMCKAEDACTQVTVFVVPPTNADDKAIQDRHNAVVTFFKARGLNDGQIRVERGFNPDVHGMARDGLAKLNKTDSGASAGATADAGSADAGGATAGGATSGGSASTGSK
jgi:hypothetical protein